MTDRIIQRLVSALESALRQGEDRQAFTHQLMLEIDAALSAAEIYTHDNCKAEPLYSFESQAKEPEASGGLCADASHAVRVGEASADLPTTSENMDVTAGETAPHPRLSAATATLSEQIEIACAAYAKATGYYVEFHRGLSSESSDRMRKGMRAALVALQNAVTDEPQTLLTREALAEAWIVGHNRARNFVFEDIDIQGCKGSFLWGQAMFDAVALMDASPVSRPKSQRDDTSPGVASHQSRTGE